ncbi:hypothetical protein Q427_31310 [Halomonas sp. BC04]|nr:hypothetical protein Q427_31310 [Halomonas sp. BC04]
MALAQGLQQQGVGEGRVGQHIEGRQARVECQRFGAWLDQSGLYTGVDQAPQQAAKGSEQGVSKGHPVASAGGEAPV